MWAVGCIFAELLTLKPLFQGVEVKATPNPFQVWLVFPGSCFYVYACFIACSLSIASCLLSPIVCHCIFNAYDIQNFSSQLDQLDKIFKVLGVWSVSLSPITFYANRCWQSLLCSGHPTPEKWPTLVNLPFWQTDLQHIQGHK